MDIMITSLLWQIWKQKIENKSSLSALYSFNVLKEEKRLAVIYQFISWKKIWFIVWGALGQNMETGRRRRDKVCKLYILLFLSLAHWLGFNIRWTVIHDTATSDLITRNIICRWQDNWLPCWLCYVRDWKFCFSELFTIFLLILLASN